MPAPLDPAGIAASRREHGEAVMLPAAAYTSPEVYAWELRHVFAGAWTCLGRADELTDGPTTHRALTVGDIAVLLTVDGGTVRALISVDDPRARPSDVHHSIEKSGQQAVLDRRQLRAIAMALLHRQRVVPEPRHKRARVLYHHRQCQEQCDHKTSPSALRDANRCDFVVSFDCVDDIHSADDMSKDGVIAVEVRTIAERDVELARIRMRATVCHTYTSAHN